MADETFYQANELTPSSGWMTTARLTTECFSRKHAAHMYSLTFRKTPSDEVAILFQWSCFASTETMRTIRNAGSPGRPPRRSQSSWGSAGGRRKPRDVYGRQSTCPVEPPLPEGPVGCSRWRFVTGESEGNENKWRQRSGLAYCFLISGCLRPLSRFAHFSLPR